MRRILGGILFILLFGQCSKSLPDNQHLADYPASSATPNFYVQLLDKNTGGNYIIENKITTSDIEFRNAFDQPISYNVSITSPNDTLLNCIVFPVTDRNKTILYIRKTIEIPIAYTSTITSAAGISLSNFTVKGFVFNASLIDNNYLLKIKI